MGLKKLVEMAIVARAGSYSPYSGFSVGAALLCADGSIYTGCNIENAAYSPTVCAERTAFFKAVSEGQRHFDTIAVVAKSGETAVMPSPCGVCRQVMAEFCDGDFKIILAKSEDEFTVKTLEELLPERFELK